MPFCNTYHLTRVSLTLDVGYLFMAAPAKCSRCSLPWMRSTSSLRLHDPMDCSPPGSIVHGILQARILEWVAILFSKIFPSQGSNPGLLHCRQILYSLSHLGSPTILYLLPAALNTTFSPGASNRCKQPQHVFQCSL